MVEYLGKVQNPELNIGCFIHLHQLESGCSTWMHYPNSNQHHISFWCCIL